jgi:hypothetical protein
MRPTGTFPLAPSPGPSPERPPQSRRALEGRLGAAQAAHDAERRRLRGGVTTRALDLDQTGWEAIGIAIAALARLTETLCAASLLCDARPRAEVLAARISEAIDDQIDAPAWRVIDACARLRVLTDR